MSYADHLFKRRHFDRLIIILCVRWYVRFKLSYRDLVEMMAERGLSMAHTTIMRWVVRFIPVFEQRWRKYSKPVGRSWRVDETYIKIKGQWKYLYRAVDKEGQTIDFLLTAHRDKKAAKRFLKKAVRQHELPDKITIDKSGANAAAIEALIEETGHEIEIRQNKYLIPSCNSWSKRGIRGVYRATRWQEHRMGRVTKAVAHLQVEGIDERIKCTTEAWRRRRWQVIRCALVNPKPAAEIALEIGLARQTVHNLVAAYNRHGPSALETPGRGQRQRAYLSLEQEQAVVDQFLKQSEVGQVSTGLQIKAALETVVGHQVAKSTVYRLLKRHQWRKLVPRPRHPQASAAEQGAFKKTSPSRSRPSSKSETRKTRARS